MSLNFDLDQVATVVLAGGLGTRVRHLLGDIPKPMASVCGRPFLEWVVRYLARQGVGKVVMSTGHLGEKIEAHFSSTHVPGVTLTCVREHEPLGTGGAFLHSVRLSRLRPAAWLVLNGDSLAFADLAEVVTKAAHPNIAGVLVGVEVKDASRFGTIDFDMTGNLRCFLEKRPGRGLISAGMYLFLTTTLEAFPATLPLSFEQEVFPALLNAGAGLKVCVSQAPFLDIGTPESLPLAEAFVDENRDQFL